MLNDKIISLIERFVTCYEKRLDFEIEREKREAEHAALAVSYQRALLRVSLERLGVNRIDS